MNPFLRYLADKNSAHRHTPMITRPCGQDLAAYGAQVTTIQTQFVCVVSKVISDGIFNERF